MTTEDMIEILGGIRACYNIFDECDRSKYHALSMAIEALKSQKHGHWINISISMSGDDSSAECDLCGAIVHNNFSNTINYCPFCGAKMDGEKYEVSDNN